jgi:uncharacterized membrane protein
MKKILFQWSELKASFWFIPVVIILISILLSIGLVYMDDFIEISQDGITRFFFVNSSDSARAILSTISGAMMGVAGTVFSITLVALTLASSQFGPRLIKNFMYVRLNQVVLGSYVSTYLYCLIVLNAVNSGDDFKFIPSISILVAILAAITNIVLLIVFIHRIATSIQADNVISDISDFISKQVQTLFPEKMGEEDEPEGILDVSTTLSAYPNHLPLKSSKSGYLQYIDGENLMEIISKNDSLLHLYHRPGGHLVEGGEIGMLYSKGSWKIGEIKKIHEQFVIGKTKTSQQDPEYSVHQMVEIAVRALSPGVNDPYTALACIDNLTSTMSYLAQAKFPSKYRLDEGGRIRIIADILTFEGILNAAFNQIRQFSGGSPAVIIRMMEALTTISEFTNDTHKKAVVKHAEMVMTMGKRTIEEKNDLQDLIERSKKIMK